MVRLVPRALALPSPVQLRDANLGLEREIGERLRAEQALQGARGELETRVQRRTADLAMANEQLAIEISDRRSAEEALRKQADLLELAHDAIIVRDMNDRITYWNAGAEKTYGWPQEQ